ncbi:hypothetical protein RGAI101_2926 [Roseobacter sp. GAI101]|nr:hypothetical protein RGAI101_2926 [Roseobacter sp. GAI101]
MWLVHVIFVISTLSVAWVRFRQLLHPVFVFTTILCVMLSDFIIRGYDDYNLESLWPDVIVEAQTTILLIFAATLCIVHLVPTQKINITSSASERLSKNQAYIFLAGAVFIIGFELFKRYISVNGSFSELILQSLQPRGERNWDQAAFNGNALFSLLTSLFPLASIVFSLLILERRGVVRFISIIGFLISMSVLITNGSRTPVVITLFIFWMLGMFRLKSRSGRIALTVASVAGVAMLTSAILLFRSTGFLEVSLSDNYEVTYHQDDSYYRAIYAYDVATTSNYNWDAATHFGVILTNPIPRAIWPNKPFLDTYFFGPYKLDYVTTLHVGEMVAIFGPVGMIIPSILCGLFVFFVLRWAYRYCGFSMGIPIYLIWALYCYMCIRSTLNVSYFIYLPLGASLVFSLQSRRRQKKILKDERQATAIAFANPADGARSSRY